MLWGRSLQKEGNREGEAKENGREATTETKIVYDDKKGICC